jgi:hypothetical protein
MNRPILACALFAFASAALCAQQPNYSGTSAPPPDDTIETSAPAQTDSLPKPNPGQSAAAQPNPANPSVGSAEPNARTDAGTVQPLTAPTRTTLKVIASDPDSDIVQPAPLPPGVLAGAQIDGHIVDVSSGRLGGRGWMRLRPETVTLANGSSFRLVAYVAAAPGAKARVDREGTIGAEARIKRGAIEYGGAVGIGVAAGAIMGGPAGALAGGLIGAGAVTVHLMVSHPQATLEPGTVLLFTLTQPLNLVSNPTTASNQPAPVSQ